MPLILLSEIAFPMISYNYTFIGLVCWIISIFVNVVLLKVLCRVLSYLETREFIPNDMNRLTIFSVGLRRWLWVSVVLSWRHVTPLGCLPEVIFWPTSATSLGLRRGRGEKIQGCRWTWKTWKTLNSVECECGSWKTWNNLKFHSFFRVEPGKIRFTKFFKLFNLHLLSMKNVKSNW